MLALARIANRPNREERVDYLGSVLLAAVLLTLSLAVSRQGLFTLSSPLPFIVGSGGLLLGGVFFWQQRRSSFPLLPPPVLRSLPVVTANLAQFLVGIALIIGLVTIPLMANTVMGRDPFTGALWLLRLTVAIPSGAVVGGVLLPILGARPVTITGLLLAAAGLLLAGNWTLDDRRPLAHHPPGQPAWASGWSFLPSRPTPSTPYPGNTGPPLPRWWWYPGCWG